jgi:hypothetical protein
MSGHHNEFSFPDVNEDEAFAFRRFMTDELVAQRMIVRDVCDCTYDGDYLDFERHLPDIGFRDKILNIPPTDRDWFDETGIQPVSSEGVIFTPIFYPCVGISFGVGRSATFLGANEAQEMSIFCPICRAQHEFDSKNDDSVYWKCVESQYSFMNGGEVGQNICPSCDSIIRNDDWRGALNQQIAVTSFFHINVWRWFSGAPDEIEALKFKDLLQAISGQRVLMNYFWT